jgi:hypothetical protein
VGWYYPALLTSLCTDVSVNWYFNSLHRVSIDSHGMD